MDRKLRGNRFLSNRCLTGKLTIKKVMWKSDRNYKFMSSFGKKSGENIVLIKKWNILIDICL